MSTSRVLFERDGAVAFLTFNRPEARNAMTWDMYDALVAACGAVDADDRVRVLVLRGMTDGHRDAIEPVLETAQLVAFAVDADGTLVPVGPQDGADALLEELVARRLAARRSGGVVMLT